MAEAESRRAASERRAELAERNNMAQLMLAQNTLVPFGGNIQSETDAVIMREHNGIRNTVDYEMIADEIQNETGRGLDMLAYYPIIEWIFGNLLPQGVDTTTRQINWFMSYAFFTKKSDSNNAVMVPKVNEDLIDQNRLNTAIAFSILANRPATVNDLSTLNVEIRKNISENDRATIESEFSKERREQIKSMTEGKEDAIKKARYYNRLLNDNDLTDLTSPSAFGRRGGRSRFGAKASEIFDGYFKGVDLEDSKKNPSVFIPDAPVFFDDTPNEKPSALTPDKLNKLKGTIKLDERVSAQLSIAAAVVVNQILQSVPSSEVTDKDSNFSSVNVIYFEDVVRHIQKNFGGVITLDPSSGDAFEAMSSGEVNVFSRKLLTLFNNTKMTMASNTFVKSPIGKPEYEMTGYYVPFEQGIARMAHIYSKRIKAILGVKASSVGKVWESNILSDDKARAKTLYTTNVAYQSTERVVKANANIQFGTKFKMDVTPELCEEAVISILTLVALHVITYALSYAIDAYIRLAIRGADRNDKGEIVFDGTGEDDSANVITPQMIFPGVKAALEMYNVDARLWDSKVAFNLRVNESLLNLFLEAKKMYDVDNTKPVVKGFMNAEMMNPAWMENRQSQAKLQDTYAKIRGRRNKMDDDKEFMTSFQNNRYSAISDGLGENIQNITDAMATLRNRRLAADDLDALVRRPIVSGFGRRHRGSKKSRKSGKRRSASFGRRHRGSKKSRKSGKRRSASFGRRHRGSKKGKKTRHSKRH